MVYKTPSSCFSVILYCVKMRKVESINFRFGGRSTSFCSSVGRIGIRVSNRIDVENLKNGKFGRYVWKVSLQSLSF